MGVNIKGKPGLLTYIIIPDIQKTCYISTEIWVLRTDYGGLYQSQYPEKGYTNSSRGFIEYVRHLWCTGKCKKYLKYIYIIFTENITETCGGGNKRLIK